MKVSLGGIKPGKGKNKERELGFGSKSYDRDTRLINKGGQFNVEKEGGSFWESLDIYHELISISWARFIGIVTLQFFIINLLFALVYYSTGPDSITGTSATTMQSRFLECFYFSTQTMTTVGFGKLSPKSDAVSLIAAFESFLGLLGFALATGLMYARFSRPRKRLLYSENAIIAPFQKKNALMFRFVNAGKNQLIEAEVDMVLSYWNEEEQRRLFEKLKLERKTINFFSSSWTIVHTINKESPLYGLTEADIKARNTEVIIMFKAFDDTYARHIYDRTSYTCREILWGKRFQSIYDDKSDGVIHVNMERIGAVEDAVLN